MLDSGTLSNVPCANNELKIDTFDELDELLCTVEERDLAAFRRVNFIYNIDDGDLDIDWLELCTARFLGTLPQRQILQLDGWTATGRLLQQAIAEASVTSFRELKTIIWGCDTSPLNELLPLWEFPVEHIEVSVAEPVPRSLKRWPDPTLSLKRLNLHLSTIADRTLAKLLRLSPCLELLRYDHWCHVDYPKRWQDCSHLTAALQQVKTTLRELDLSMGLCSDFAEEVECLEISPVKGQLGPLQEFSCLRKLKAPIVTLLGWSPDELLRLAEVVPTGLTHLGLTEDLAQQCTYKWDEEFVLEELAVFLSVWRSVTPNLQVVEVWLTRIYGRWKDTEVAQLRKVCEEAGVLCIVHFKKNIRSPMTFQWVRQGPREPRPKPLQLPSTQPTVERIHDNDPVPLIDAIW
jgi:hypothetical protein